MFSTTFLPETNRDRLHIKWVPMAATAVVVVRAHWVEKRATVK
jgi:hypothetical protein